MSPEKEEQASVYDVIVHILDSLEEYVFDNLVDSNESAMVLEKLTEARLWTAESIANNGTLAQLDAEQEASDETQKETE